MGELEGIKVTKEVTICIRLFADDMGVFIKATEENFKKLQDILNLYKTAVGAKMNMAKMVIIPLGFIDTPQWIQTTRCKISEPRELQQYLGAPIGNKLFQTDLHNFYLDKISKRISRWSN